MTEDSHHQLKLKKGIFDSIFPVEYDFEYMLAEQARKTLECVDTLVLWLQKIPLSEPNLLKEQEENVDAMRYDLEEKLLDSFSTPFDRQDIYSLSRQMDYIVNYSYEVAREMYAFGVQPDDAIRSMADALLKGTRCAVQGVEAMSKDKKRVEGLIRAARKSMRMIDDLYIHCMADLFHQDDAMEALRKREIYHHLRDAGRALRMTVDILHHAVVGLS
ncbi:MAG: hypothetical protein A4E42_00130 [Methanoregulaceae archaeon PtaU1.Bin222]|nr:MAG: hypothetical protein A4E42_00130 [Methanoregulaceae archaeon PtaU1.Bin222]